MKRLGLMLFLVLPLFLVVEIAEAKRFGGGRSLGRTFSTPSFFGSAARTNRVINSTQKKSGFGGGILGGLLVGLGLGALFSSLGIGAGMGNLLVIALIALLAFFIMSRLGNAARKRQPVAYRTSGYDSVQERNIPSASAATVGSALSRAQGVWNIPEDFDSLAFLSQAKERFMEMQSAWDNADISAVKHFATDEVVDAVKREYSSRQGKNHTEVLSLNANLLGISEESGMHVACVKFTGAVNEGSGLSSFSELWYWVKSTSGGGGWLLSGVEQA